MPSTRFRDKIHAGIATTFNDVLLLPGFTAIEPEEVDISTRLTKKISLRIPFVSSPMDTVTESRMAIAIARQGGLGFIHRNCSTEEQVKMVRKVKRAESFIITDVITISQDETVAKALQVMNEKNINGLPVVENDRLIGIVTGRDVRFARDTEKLLVKDVMTRDLITASKDISIDEAIKLLHEHRIEKLPVTDNGQLIGLITVKDLMLKGKFPNASRDEEGSLLCGAAISPFDFERALALDKVTDVLITDVSHFHNENCFAATKKLLKELTTPLIVGNIGTYEAAIDCLTKLEGIAGLRAGIGSGSICSTSVVTRAGAPTLFATANCADALSEVGGEACIIADGGIKNPGDVALALGAGASVVMIGNIFAGTTESPGRLVGFEGRYYKQYYGMGSQAARERRFALDRYSQPSKDITEGVEGYVPFRGTVADVLHEFLGGLKASMGYVGARTIKEMWEKAKFIGISQAGARETHPHDIFLPDKSTY
ncbi:MAG: IMP dehydrogenase [Candidatus Helarchaeales archaeon]